MAAGADATVTFVTVSDEGFFPGTAALVNSLRVTGRRERILVVDCGLADDQRRRLATEAEVVEAPAEECARGMLLKPYACSLVQAGLAVWIDSDMVVTGPLDRALALAAAGRLAAYPDDRSADDDRFHPEWASLFGLRDDLRQQRYVNAGFLAYDAGRWDGLVARWRELVDAVPLERIQPYSKDAADPVWAGDQDVLNALLMSEVEPGRLSLLPAAEEAYYDALPAVRIEDPATLACRRATGEHVTLLHYSSSPKAWRRSGWTRHRRDAYTLLLPRLVLADDVPVRLAPGELPLRLRPEAVGRIAAGLAHGAGRAYRVGYTLSPPPLRRAGKRALRAVLHG